MYALIEQIVADHFGIPREHLFDNKRNVPRVVSDARHFIWYILYSVLEYKPKSIAEKYGFTTRGVFLAVAEIRDGIRLQPYFAIHYKQIQQELKKIDIG